MDPSPGVSPSGEPKDQTACTPEVVSDFGEVVNAAGLFTHLFQGWGQGEEVGENCTWDQHLSAATLPYFQSGNKNSCEGIYSKCRLQAVEWVGEGAEEPSDEQNPCRWGGQCRPAHQGRSTGISALLSAQEAEWWRGRTGPAASGSMTRCSCCSTWPWHQPTQR